MSLTLFEQVFKFSGTDIKVYGTSENPWFKGNNIASILGYEKPHNAVTKHVELEDKMSFKELLEVTSFQCDLDKISYNDLKTIYINEAGLYSLILRSKLETARLFKKWITSEVLPSIRKTGSYQLNKQLGRKRKIMIRI